MAHPSLAGLSVLLVDDSRAMRLIVKSLLQTLGISDVIEAGDGEEALKLLAAHRRDLVITDLSMHPMNGMELTRRLRQPESGTNALVPILMVTGHSELRDVHAALEAGVTEFLVKPVNRAALQRKLEAVILRPRALVQAPSYVGPDRRRRTIAGKTRRRRDDGEAPTLL